MNSVEHRDSFVSAETRRADLKMRKRMASRISSHETERSIMIGETAASGTRAVICPSRFKPRDLDLGRDQARALRHWKVRRSCTCETVSNLIDCRWRPEMAKSEQLLPPTDEHSEDTLAGSLPRRRVRPSERLDLEAERKIWERNIELINEQGRALVESSADR